jgi:ArsR family transcriptional regulator
METTLTVDVLGALAQPTRLAVFRLLVCSEPGGMASGDIARQLDVPHNTMSSHLAILERAGLVSGLRSGRSMIYRARVEAIRDLVMFLLDDCCNGRPELCSPVLEALAAAPRSCC